MKERVESGVTVQRVGEELDIDPHLIWVWAKEVDAAPPGARPDDIFPGFGRKRSYSRREIKAELEVGPESAEQELKRLRKENERLRQERDFLKKAAAFFAKESH